MFAWRQHSSFTPLTLYHQIKVMKYTTALVLAGVWLIVLGCQKEQVTTNTPPNENAGSQSINLLQETFEKVPIVVVGTGRRDLIVAFRRDRASVIHNFEPVQNRLPVVMSDQLGNEWNIFGRAVNGPDQGAQLEYVNSGMGFWFAFGAFFPGLDLYGAEPITVEVSADTTEEWAIPTAYVGQGTGFDGIASLQNPNFINYSPIQINPDDPFYIGDEDLVIAVSLNGETKVYPHKILDWHEVINDEVGDVPVTVTYCPLTGTGKVWRRQGQDAASSFGVSGALYNSNLLAFDRSTESFWSQLEAVCVFGDRMGERMALVPFVETKWGTWRSIDPAPLVMDKNTGIDRDYNEYPYGNYRSSPLISYPLLYEDDRLFAKERVFSVIVNGKAKVYRRDDF